MGYVQELLHIIAYLPTLKSQKSEYPKVLKASVFNVLETTFKRRLFHIHFKQECWLLFYTLVVLMKVNSNQKGECQLFHKSVCTDVWQAVWKVENQYV